MSALPADIAPITGTSITLQVASRRRDDIVGGHLNIAKRAVTLLRERAERTVTDLEALDSRPYWPDANLAAGSEYYEIPRKDLEDSLGVLRFLDLGADTPLLAPEDMAGRLLFYAAVLGDDPTRTVAFVAKSNPAQELGRGLWLTPHGDTLTTVDTPLFLFEDRVDLVVGPETVLVLNQLAFEQWFRESPAIAEHIEKWIEGIEASLPIAGTGKAMLAKRAETNSRVRRLLRNITERGHLRDVSIDRIRIHLGDQGLDSAQYLAGDELLVGDDPGPLLRMLNEDLFRGGLTSVPFVSDNKEPRR
jgi:hypothetical protein